MNKSWRKRNTGVMLWNEVKLRLKPKLKLKQNKIKWKNSQEVYKT